MNKYFLYKWQGITLKGECIQGIDYSVSKNALIESLKEKDIAILKIRKKLLLTHSFAHKDISRFTRQLTTLIQYGITLRQAFTILINNAISENWRRLLIILNNNIEKGYSLTASLECYPQYFTTIYRGMISAGEKTGKLIDFLMHLSDYLELMLTFKNKIRKSLHYPILVLIVTIIISLGLMIYVLPQFEALFLELNSPLPLYTQFIFGIAHGIRHYCFPFIVFLIGCLCTTFISKKLSARIHYFQRFIYDIPVIKNLLVTIHLSIWTRVLSVSTQAGLPLISSLKLAQETLKSPYLRSHFSNVIQHIEEGNSLKTAFRSCGLFCEHTLQLVAIAENSGSLDAMLSRIADMYQQQLDERIDTINQLLEPCIVILLALFAGGFIFALYLPILQMGTLM